ncbi:MAG: type Z 30S ribosomal protein S14 [Chloroflexi bacterium]|nr:type Z 30S ribosomal protein S14 [Chloroflexota bacterium]
MAKKSKLAKWKREAPYKVRAMNRCNRCGRPRASIRFAGLCRFCFRLMALTCKLPGLRKASW